MLPVNQQQSIPNKMNISGIKKISIATLAKIVSLKLNMVKRIKESREIFEVIDKNYNERIAYNVRVLQYDEILKGYRLYCKC